MNRLYNNNLLHNVTTQFFEDQSASDCTEALLEILGDYVASDLHCATPRSVRADKFHTIKNVIVYLQRMGELNVPGTSHN